MMIVIIIGSVLLLATTMIYFSVLLSKVNMHIEHMEIYMQECSSELREQEQRQRDAIYDFVEKFNREYDNPKIYLNTEGYTLLIEVYDFDNK